MKYALNYRNKQFEKEEVMINYESTKLDKSEEQTLHYIGFVLYKLFGLVKHKEKPEGKVMEQVLSVWGAKGKFPEHNPMSFFDYTNAWVWKINRGGLYDVSDQFYLFIRAVELVVRRVLNCNLIVTYAGEELREVLLSKLLKHEYVQIYWSTITRHIDNTVLIDTLQLKILQTWINIRAYFFIKTWINVMKRKSAKLYSRSSIVTEFGRVLFI